MDNLQFKFRFAGHGGSDAYELQQVLVPIRTDEECTKAYENENDVINEKIQFCAGYKEGGKDACDGQFLFFAIFILYI